MNNAFVFVVCGSAEHTDTLAMSYQILNTKTKNPIYIVTDTKRNENQLDFPNVIDVNTPVNFNHHQASIFLKTSLHKILPKGFKYAYLDTDIIAYGTHPDEIFNQFIPPIRFAPDHCKMNQFSPYAVNCGCIEMFEKKRVEVNALMAQYDEFSNSTDPEITKLRSQLFREFDKIKSNGIPKLSFYFLYLLSWPVFHLTNEFTLNKKTKLWYFRDHTPIMRKLNMHKIARKANLKWNYIRNEMTLHDGRNLWSNYCLHLKHSIHQSFQVNINENDWQHWNGGVFIFSDESQEFMETWHRYTMEIFKNTEWKTRDQGTLIATVWKFGLQNHPTLDIKWNMILDYHNQQLEINKEGDLTIDGKHHLSPEFVHIYHHWGDTTWNIWNQVMIHANDGQG